MQPRLRIHSHLAKRTFNLTTGNEIIAYADAYRTGPASVKSLKAGIDF